MEKQIEEQSHTMQAALALSPSNKASTRLANGETFLVQEYAHEHYRIWIVPPGDIPIWSGQVMSTKSMPSYMAMGLIQANVSGELWGQTTTQRHIRQAMEAAREGLA